MPRPGSYDVIAVTLVAAFLLCTDSSGGDEPKPALPADHAERMKAGVELFKKHVRPVLVKHCLECHGQTVKADFDLSDRKRLIESGMVGDDAQSSHLYDVITHAAEPHMPHQSDKLPEEALAHIARWLDLGAPYDKPLLKKGSASTTAKGITDAERNFWSFRPLRRESPPPAVAPSSSNGTGGSPLEDWPRTSIDRFILETLSERGLHPNPRADRRTLIRRAYFDLIGLPPTPEEIDAFLDDDDPLAWETLLDRLLSSPHYGERWARHWMDVARFAESHGYEQDYDRPHAYHYRDFLIRAFNEDMPYDQFVLRQIAGDEQDPEDPSALAATGFLGGGAFPTQLTEAEFEAARYDEMDDMLATTGSAFLGLSIGCARCHDHKFDPIPTRDYYRLLATFTTTIRSEVELPVPGEDEPVTVQITSEGVPPMKHHADGRGYPHFYPETYLLARGDVDQKQEAVSQSFLQVLMPPGRDAAFWQIEPLDGDETRDQGTGRREQGNEGGTGEEGERVTPPVASVSPSPDPGSLPPLNESERSYRRTALARWMTDPDDGAGHLAARVIVNRLWQHHFGRGIVATPNDFGVQGAPPTHPELLDWLAADLIEHGWSLKRLHKLMMTSAVYMQSSEYDADRARVDPENHLLWRWTPRRIEGEAVRDSMLHVAGMLETTLYGPGTLDQGMRRRSIYFFIKRSELIPMMMLFDWPEHLVSIGRRSTTTIAPQALLFMNSPQARTYASGFAERVRSESDDASIGRAWRLAFGRSPTEQERQASAAFLERQTSAYRESGNSSPAKHAWTDFCQGLLGMNEFVYLD